MSRSYGLRSGRLAAFAASVAPAALCALVALPASAATPALIAMPAPISPPSTPSPVGPPESAGSPPASLPPELLALEQKMQELHLSGAKVSFHQTLRITPLLAHGAHVQTLSGASGVVEVDYARHVARLRERAGRAHLEARLIGNTLYARVPALTRRDGGRPWVRAVVPKHLPERLNLGPKLLDAGPSFALLRSDLAGAVSVSQDGTATVQGKQTIQFTATFKGPGHTAIGGPQPRQIPETGTLQLFVEPSGLPVQTIGTVTDGMAVMSTTSTLEGVNMPVRVKAPPARLTIGQRALRRLQRRIARRQARRVRRCLRRANREGRRRGEHGRRLRKRVQRCLRSIDAGHGEASGKLVIKG